MPSHRAQCEKARAKWDAASSAFCSWAIANGFGMVKRSDIAQAIAGNAEGERLLATDNATRTLLDDAERAAVEAGHAWRGSFGSLQFYSPAEIRRFAAQRRRSA